jgi:hypothetical protein
MEETGVPAKITDLFQVIAQLNNVLLYQVHVHLVICRTKPISDPV